MNDSCGRDRHPSDFWLRPAAELADPVEWELAAASPADSVLPFFLPALPVSVAAGVIPVAPVD